MKLTPVTNPIDARLDAKANKVDVQNNFGDVVGLLAGWTADMRGGRNLLLDSKPNVTNSQYLTTSLYLAPNHGLVAGDTVTISLKGQLGSDRTSFRLYNTNQGGPDVILDMPPSTRGTDGVFKITAPWKIGSGGNTRVHIFAVKGTTNEVPTTDSTVEWVKIERGTRSTPWTPAPEDSVAKIKESGVGVPLVNPLPPIDHSLALRLDTTVGTRVFAGNTMIYGDTGWRDVTSLLINGWTATAFRIKRIGDLVYWKVVGLSSANATSRDFLSSTPGISPGEFTLIKLGGVDIQVEWNGIARIASATYQGLNITDYSVIITTRNQSWPGTQHGLPA